MITEQIKTLSWQLRLFGVHQHFEKRIQSAAAQGQNAAEFLRLLLEDELLARKDMVAKRLLTKAKFRHAADLEDWDHSFDRGISKQKLKDLASLAFFQNKENLLLLGRTGEGKTHLAIALGRRLCLENFTVAFLPVNNFFEEVIAQKSRGRLLAHLKSIAKTNLIIFDDFGLRPYTHDEATVLVDILEERHKKAPVIITSQVDPQGWTKLFEDPVIAEAIVDRVVNPSQKIILKGGSYREKLNPKKSS